MNDTFTIGPRVLRHGCDPYLIAEIGINHNGDWDLARQTIDAAAAAGANAVKFQSFRAEEFMADRQMQYEYHCNGQTVRESMYEMFKRLELPRSWHEQLQAYARERQVDFLSSAADVISADLLASLKVPAIKLASEDLINLPLLAHVAGLNIPLILSTGMADEEEIERALGIVRSNGNPSWMLLHCVSLYPAPDEQANLRRMVALRERFGGVVGYSDHTAGCVAAVAATALGAVLIEKHFTLDRTLPGPDHAFSADPLELAELVRQVRQAATQCGTGGIAPSAGEWSVREQFRRSVVAAVDIPAGSVMTREMLWLKRPCVGILPHEMDSLVGRRAARTIRADEPITWKDVQ